MTSTLPVKRLSMWSGPRNISTALMHAFGNRPDCLAIDEPFYAYYLSKTGLQHPMREEVMASQPQDWQQVMTALNGSVSSGKSLLYIKHMTQHMLPDIDKSQLLNHSHCFLIRDPRLVIASFAEKHDQVTAEATGFRQQCELFHYFTSQNIPVCVIEGEDIQKAPQKTLQHLCDECGIPFDDTMLSWAPGRKPEDGVWAAHWYNAVEKSTSFAPFKEKQVQLTADQEDLARELYPFYLEMKRRKLII